MNRHLLIIDPQFDFCDPSGALYVPGAEKDMARLASFIDRLGDNIKDIHVTLDSHNKLDISHPDFWVDSNGNHPSPFTIITHNDVELGKWIAHNGFGLMTDKVLKYTKELENNGKYSLMIWPEHCLIGSKGHSVNDELFSSLMGWSSKSKVNINFITKGDKPMTEHYSAVKTEVPDEWDDETDLNEDLLKILEGADEVIIAGEALSHCVASTITDIADNFVNQNNIKKLVLLEDCTSSVPGFESNGNEFVEKLKARGMRVVKSNEYNV